MNLEIPDIDDEYIGLAILTVMFFFMMIWLTSAASPINFPHRAQIGIFVGHIEVILIVVIPIALLGMIEAIYGGAQKYAKSNITVAIERATERAKAFREKHRYKQAKDEKSEKPK